MTVYKREQIMNKRQSPPQTDSGRLAWPNVRKSISKSCQAKGSVEIANMIIN